jgi:hypothetical protein
MNDERFDELLKDMREEGAAEEQVAGARERVWQRLEGASSAACVEFRPEFSDYLAGRLTPSRRLLMDDHLGRCPECRRALADAKGERKVVAMPRVDSPRRPAWMRWAAVAAVLLAAFYLGRDSIDSAFAPAGPRATVVSVSGQVYRLGGDALSAGSLLEEGEVVRTAAGARAVIELTDGSLVEINQRTELALRAAWSGMTVRLDRGDVMVQAAEQRRGQLRVVTRDSVASVKGTIFAVSSGTAGSVVSVVAGAVAVAQPGANTVLTAGQQAASNRALQVNVQEAISWSEDAEKYYSILAEFSAIEKELAAMPGPGVRHESALLAFLPAGALAYFAIPNLEGTIRQALYLVDRRAEDNAALNEWWSSEDGQSLRQKLDRIQAITPLLGDELVCILGRDPAGAKAVPPIVLAQIQAGREDALRDALERIAENAPESVAYQIGGGMLFVSDSQEGLALATAQLGSGASSPFAAEILRRYQDGVSWIAAVDVGMFVPEMEREPESRLLGLPGMRYVFFEQGAGGGRDLAEATLSFEGARTGVSSWLAPPGSSGSAEYVSDQAIAVVSGSTRDPRQAFDELLTLAGPESGFAVEIRELESDLGISVGDDIASSLGTDFTFSLEQLSLPAPGGLVVCEVRNPGALDDVVRRLVDARNGELGPEDEDRRITMTQETVNGRTWNRISLPGKPGALNWTYDRGYLVASMDRAVATRAIAVRDAGSSLVHSVLFQERYPVTASLHSSGFFWLNANSVVSDLASLVNSPALQKLAGSREPVLVVVNGEMERIHAASRTRLTSLILDLMLMHGVDGRIEHGEENEPVASL